MHDARITVAIPTLNGATLLEDLLPRLADQTLPPIQVLVVDSSSDDNTVEVAKRHGADVHVIPRSEFNHGRTRNLAVSLAKGDIVVFLSHDVKPISVDFLERVTAPIRTGKAVAAYAKQIGGPHAKPTERFLREYNYPEEGHLRGPEDIDKLGLHAFFFSNAAGCYQIEAFQAVGGFPTDTILGEDLIISSKLLRAGHCIAYASDAVVEHTHNYTLMQQFRRYFDTGVAHREARADLQTAAKVAKGREFVIKQVKWMILHKTKRWIPYGMAESMAKLIGYKLGQYHTKIPLPLKRRLSMHRHHWSD